MHIIHILSRLELATHKNTFAYSIENIFFFFVCFYLFENLFVEYVSTNGIFRILKASITKKKWRRKKTETESIGSRIKQDLSTMRFTIITAHNFNLCIRINLCCKRSIPDCPENLISFFGTSIFIHSSSSSPGWIESNEVIGETKYEELWDDDEKKIWYFPYFLAFTKHTQNTF